MSPAARAVALILLGSATAAQAQTTNCSPDGIGGLTCNTAPTAAQGIGALGQALAMRREHKRAATLFQDAIANGRCDEARGLAITYGDRNDLDAVARCAALATQGANLERNWMAGISRAVAEGRCEDAKNAALGAGRLDVADQAMRVCTPAKP